MKTFRSLTASVLTLGVALAVAACSGGAAPAPPQEASAPTAPSAATAKPAPTPGDAYVCPMHPEVTSGTPADCPKCGMHLELRSAAAPAASSTTAPAASTSSTASAASTANASNTTARETYVCPMCPGVTSQGPADCPKCGMHLVPQSEVSGGSGDHASHGH